MEFDLASVRSRPAPAPGGPFRLLVVCTGNICRSAFAAAYFDAVLGERLSLGAVSIESAGTDVALGLEMPPPVADAIRSVGGEPAVHVITALEPGAAATADLVVTMTRRQRAEVVRRVPRAARHVVTLKQLARLCEGASSPRPGGAQGDAEEEAAALRRAVDAAIGRRGLTPANGDDDIADPWMRSDEVYARSLGEIRSAGAAVASYLLAATMSGTP